ncbi:MAG: 1-acyl-sn-glycerol-3-phosphate acyltransferase [Bacteroidetes bacterium]|nr:1-acyl-sn-glycerol-3-phosphate acyltransferase [Bacteroidota bacterium]
MSIKVHNKKALQQRGPLLIVANHPDSFFDALVIAANCTYPISFLARGDVFTKPWHNFLLRALNMMPVYRQREGKEHLHKNQNSFDASVAVFKNGGTVLIFIEGICLNKNEIQPFKKGAARILQQAVAAGVTPAVLPAVITYNGFKHFGKKIYLMLGTTVSANQFFNNTAEPENTAIQRNNFNNHVMREMLSLYKEPPSKKYKRPLYLFPIIGIAWFWHAPLFLLIKTFAAYKTKGTVFYDSVLFALLLFAYPIYLLFLFLLLSSIGISNLSSSLIIAAHPLLAIIYTQSKK